MIVSEMVAVLGAKVEQGDFADVFALLNKVQEAAIGVAHAVDEAIRKGFEIVAKVAERGDQAGATAEQFGIAASAIQELGYAATLSDSDAASLTTSLKFLSKAAVAAGEGTADAVKAFKGVNLKGPNGQIKSADALLMELADQFAAMPQGAAKMGRAFDLFGRAGADMIPLLNRGAGGIAALRAEAQALGVVLDSDAIAASEAWDDSLKRLQGTFTGLENRFASPVIGKVGALFDKLRVTLTSKGMVRAVEALSVGFGRVVDTMSAFVDVIGWLTQNEGVVTVGIFVLTSALMGLAAWAATAGAAMVGAAITSAAAWVVAGLPFIALGALILLIVDELYTFIEGGDTLLGDFIGWLNEIDPEGNPLVRLLKTAGALLFDLTDGKKWEALGQAIVDYATAPLKNMLDLLKRGMAYLGIDTKSFNFNVDTSLANVAPALFGDKAKAEQAASGNGALTNAFPGLADPLSLGGQSLGPALDAKFPGVAPLYDQLNGWDTSAGNFISGNVSAPSDMVSRNTTVTAPITITVGPGTDPNEVGEVVRKAVREELMSELGNAHAANGGY